MDTAPPGTRPCQSALAKGVCNVYPCFKEKFLDQNTSRVSHSSAQRASKREGNTLCRRLQG